MTSLRAGAATDTGQVRANNQDAVLVAEPVFAVADGMGGHAAGEIASQVAVESLQAQTASSLDGVVEAVRVANRAVWERASGNPDLRGMGTTMCVIALVPGSDGGDDVIIVANVGDSRVYQFHDGDITQLTDDHSLVEDLVREGRLSHEEARTHPQRNILTRVLGNEPDVEVDSWEVIPRSGDRYLLCSDGLFNEVDDERMASVLRRLADPEDAAHELVALANQGGGRDNISVVVVDVVDDDGGGGATRSSGPAPKASGRTSGAITATVPSVPMPPPADAPPAPSAGTGGRAAMPPMPHRSATSTLADSGKGSKRARRLTWRSALFVCGVLVVLGGAAAAVSWFARSTYYVGVDDGQVAIFRGRPGGLLWVQPTLTERTDLDLESVPAARRDAVTAGRQEPSLSAARDYVAMLEEQAEPEPPDATVTTTTSTTSTTSSIPTTSSRFGTTTE